MNSRERVVMTLNHKEPDIVPIDLTSTTVTSITYPAYENLRHHVGMDPAPHCTITPKYEPLGFSKGRGLLRRF
jgi:hypothetical protein